VETLKIKEKNMDVAVILAKILGPLLVIFGLWCFLAPAHMKKGLLELTQSAGLQFIYGLINLLVGLVVITLYNYWSGDLFVFVTLVGWALFLRGVALWFMPKKFLHSRRAGSLYGNIFKYLVLVWGVILVWAGYFLQ